MVKNTDTKPYREDVKTIKRAILESQGRALCLVSGQELSLYFGIGLYISAHHSRLWNILVDITPMKYFNKDANKIWLSNDEVQTSQSSKLHYTLCIILYLLQAVNPKTKFRQHFKDLLVKYPNVNVGYMGFPVGWENHPIWQNAK